MRRNIRKITVNTAKISSNTKITPRKSQPGNLTNKLSTSTLALRRGNDALIENISYTQHIPGDIIILGKSKQNLPSFTSNKKIVFVDKVSEINSKEISFIYINVNMNSRNDTIAVLNKVKDLMSWGSIFFIPKYQGYQGKTKYQVEKKSNDPGSAVWDEFIEDNYFSTYTTKQKVLNNRNLKEGTEDHLVIKFFPGKNNSDSDKSDITVVTVLKGGGSYNTNHVINIFNSCKKNLKIPFKFVCLTDVQIGFENPEIIKIPLIHNWPGYWSKIEMFREGIFDEGHNIFYIDLDTLITNDITDIVTVKSDFFGMRDFNTLNLLSSAIMKFTPSKNHYIYNTFKQDPNTWMKCRGGDQEAIHKILLTRIDYIQDLFPRRMAEFLNHCWVPRPSNRNKIVLPEYSSIICFHGQPKMDSLLNYPIIKQHFLI